jgi:hypothetical protein
MMIRMRRSKNAIQSKNVTEEAEALHQKSFSREVSDPDKHHDDRSSRGGTEDHPKVVASNRTVCEDYYCRYRSSG